MFRASSRPTWPALFATSVADIFAMARSGDKYPVEEGEYKRLEFAVWTEGCSFGNAFTVESLHSLEKLRVTYYRDGRVYDFLPAAKAQIQKALASLVAAGFVTKKGVGEFVCVKNRILEPPPAHNNVDKEEEENGEVEEEDDDDDEKEGAEDQQQMDQPAPEQAAHVARAQDAAAVAEAQAAAEPPEKPHTWRWTMCPLFMPWTLRRSCRGCAHTLAYPSPSFSTAHLNSARTSLLSFATCGRVYRRRALCA